MVAILSKVIIPFGKVAIEREYFVFWFPRVALQLDLFSACHSGGTSLHAFPSVPFASNPHVLASTSEPAQ